MNRPNRRGVVVALIALAWLGGGGAARAAGPTFSVTTTNRAPYFIFNSRPGAVITGTVRVVNVSSVAGQAKLFGVDATTGQTSGAVYQSQGAAKRDVGAWISLASSTVNLGAHQGAQVSFSVKVPPNARGGQHLGGLVVSPVKPTNTSTAKHGSHTFHVNIQEIAIVAVQVNLPGNLTPKLAATGIKASGRPGYQTLLLALSNPGNSLVKGSGKFQVFRGSRQVLSQSFPLDTMVPQTSIDYPIYVRGPRLPPGSYTGHITIHYAGRVLNATSPFTISSGQVRQTYGSTVPKGAPAGVGSSSGVPVWAIILGALLLVAISVGVSALVFRRRSEPR